MVGQLAHNVVDGVLEIQPKRDRSNDASEDIPATRRYELAEMLGRKFGIILITTIMY